MFIKFFLNIPTVGLRCVIIFQSYCHASAIASIVDGKKKINKIITVRTYKNMAAKFFVNNKFLHLYKLQLNIKDSDSDFWQSSCDKKY